MVIILQGGDESEAEVSRVTSKAFQNALKSLGIEFQVLEYSLNLVEDIKKLNPEKCLIAMHGKYGEDGVVQGILEHLGVPYAGSGIQASSLSFDKFQTQAFAKQCGVPVLPHKICSLNMPLSAKDLEEIQSWGGYVVKPTKSGSSRGVSLCDELSELRDALKEAFLWGEEVMVEKRMRGRELAISLYKGRAFEPIEIRPKTGFYDMKNKYTPGATEYLIPAPLPSEVSQKCKNYAEEVFRKFKIADYARVDFLISKDGAECFLLEVNTLPGCTPTSLFPKALNFGGIGFESLIEDLVNSASLKN